MKTLTTFVPSLAETKKKGKFFFVAKRHPDLKMLQSLQDYDFVLGLEVVVEEEDVKKENRSNQKAR